MHLRKLRSVIPIFCVSAILMVKYTTLEPNYEKVWIIAHCILENGSGIRNTLCSEYKIKSRLEDNHILSVDSQPTPEEMDYQD
jgi:hypothetical protein